MTKIEIIQSQLNAAYKNQAINLRLYLSWERSIKEESDRVLYLEKKLEKLIEENKYKKEI